MAEMRAARESGVIAMAKAVRNSPGLSAGANSLGARVKLARKRLGLSQQELAGPQYVASYISAIERDKIHPSLKALELIAKRLGEPVEFFLYGGYGSGALQEVEAGVGTIPPATPESSITLAVRDQLRQAQLFLERGAYLSKPQSSDLFAQVASIIEQVPRHQLTEYDRAVVSQLSGILAFHQENYDQAIAELSQALQLAGRTGQPGLEMELHYWLGNAFFARRLLDQALIHHQTCQGLLAKNKELAAPELNLQVLTALANDHLALGHSEQVLSLFEEALRTETENERLQVRAERFWQLAQVYQENGDLVRARNYWLMTQVLYEQLNQRRQLLRLSSGIGEILTSQGKVDEAEKILLRAVEAGRDNQNLSSSDLALTYNALAMLRIQQGNLDEAARISQAAIQEARKAGDRLAEGNALRLAAEVETRLEHQPAARKLYEQAIAILEATNMSYALGDVYKAYGEALSHWGDFESAVNFLKKAYDSKG